MGRRKIFITKIDSKSARMITFTKRRQGLFKKAAELSILCGVEIAVLAFSPAGRPFSFGHPSVDSVLARFGLHTHAPLVASSPSSSMPIDGGYWWESDLAKLADQGLLLRAKMALEELKENVRRRLGTLSLPDPANAREGISAAAASGLAGASNPSASSSCLVGVPGLHSSPSDSWKESDVFEDVFDSLPQLCDVFLF